MRNISLFQKAVYEATKKVPCGKVSTYKIIAEIIDNPKAYRAVGNALNKNTNKNIPCHRIVRSNGHVGDYHGGAQRKIQKLRQEGITIKDGKINLKKFLWS